MRVATDLPVKRRTQPQENSTLPMPLTSPSAARNRPRVAAIGLSETQLPEIRAYCGDLRPAPFVNAYLLDFSWTETDIVVAGGFNWDQIDPGVHLLTIGTMSLGFLAPEGHRPGSEIKQHVRMDTQNREREVTVAIGFSGMYRGPAEQLAKQLGEADDPPPTVTVTNADELLRQHIVETSGHRPVALRLQWADRVWGAQSESPLVDVVALHLPSQTNLSARIRAFLTDISEFDPQRVPEPPARLSDPTLWNTASEDAIARTISEIDREQARLDSERRRLEQELATEARRADATVRRTIWEDGDELVDAVSEVLDEIGFTVEEMDEAKQAHEAKHEDLRLTFAARPGWQAIVEVKGYTKGIRTKDAQQVRMHKERCNRETRRDPDLTIWLVNPWRQMDPSDRTSPDRNVHDTAEIVGAVCVLTTDLYRLWKSLKAGDIAQDDVVGLLVEAEAGLWRLSPAP